MAGRDGAGGLGCRCNQSPAGLQSRSQQVSGSTMKLGSLKEGGRDGTLIVVDRELKRAVRATNVAPTLQKALDNWATVSPRLAALAEELRDDKAPGSFELDTAALAAPLPRAYQWADGSAYVVHVELVRKARGVEMPPSFWTDFVAALNAFGCGPCVKPDGCTVIMPGWMLSRLKKLPLW